MIVELLLYEKMNISCYVLVINGKLLILHKIWFNNEKFAFSSFDFVISA